MPKHIEVIAYPEDGWDTSRILDVISRHRIIKHYVIICHDRDVDEHGRPIKPHIHIYLNFGQSNATFQNVANWFGIDEHCVNRVKGHMYDVVRYYTHQDYPEKAYYAPHEMVSDLDIEQFLSSHPMMANLDNILDKCAAGVITRFNYDKFIHPVIFAKHESKIKKAWEFADHVHELKTAGHRSCNTIWVYGESGTGKTTVCRLLSDAQEQPVYQTATGRDPFSHYCGEPVVIIDDLRPNEQMSYVDLLKMVDPHHSCPVHSRYRNKILKCDQIFITTALSPEAFAAACNLSADDSCIQLYRRLAEVWHVTTDTIEIRKFDMGKKKFILTAMARNPVPEYLASINIPVPKINGSLMLNNLANKFQSQLMLQED